ncbi:MAG: Glycosyl transferase group 1 [Parcubacteria group bacterium GW2011_GWA1_47_8]|nr:MAG: Glycosyl transferase group 1 [Parcubacteria group bacterium GW2011_GWA1_47_8]KKW07835.1 MAG: Glycosyl transferase group 1 [Parcubacteria group bacterium GW2011_GWA2_49_16]
MFGWEFPPHNSGGLGTACFGLSRALAARKVEVVFVLPKKVDVSASFMDMVFADTSHIKFHTIESDLKPYVTSEGYIRERDAITAAIYGKTLLDEVRRYALAAGEIAKKEHFDVIHAHDWLSFLAGLEAKRVSGKPLIVHMHATEFDRTGGQGTNQEVYNIERLGMERADGIIAVSNFTKQKIMQNYGIPADKIEVVHNGIDEADYVNIPNHLSGLKRAGQKIVLFAGRITIQKGPEYFIRAAKRVLDIDPNVLFLVSGSGDMERQMMMEAAHAGIADKVLFVGFLRGDDLTAAYRAADLFVMPSVSEPFGLTPLESIIAGAPVLISKQSGVSEVLTHALKADFWDIDDMANKILSVVQHQVLKDTLWQNSRNEVRQVSWDAASKKCIDYYEKIMCNCGSSEMSYI